MNDRGESTLSEGHYWRMRGRPRRLTARGMTAGLVSVSAAAAFLATAGAAQAVPSSKPVGAAGIVPAGSARIGALSSRTIVRIDVVIQPRDPAALSQYAAQVSTPGSALYHDYIARGQFARLFGPTSATINSVYAALRARGLSPGAISPNHLSIPVTATAGQLESAFGMGMASYRLAGGGTGFANTSAPRLPANVASQIQAIIGLDNLTRMHSFAMAPSKASGRPTRSRTMHPAGEPTGGPQPCSAATSQQLNGGLTADELAFSYEFSPLYKAGDFGRGTTVGIVEFGEPNLKSDIATFQSCYGTHTSVSYDKVDGFNTTGPGAGEATLDIEVVISEAPGASIIVYQAPNTGAASYDIYRVMVNQDKARVISESYGLCEFYQDPRAANAVTVLYEQAAVQGQTIVASSGDTGSEGCLDNDGVPTRLSVNFPASDPLVLGVGGTTLFKVNPRPGETVWNEQSLQEGAGGGGKSTFYSQPFYQKDFGIKSSVRQVPDVSADADPSTGYVIFNSNKTFNGWSQIGGTSGAAPLWAAFLALTDTKCPASPVGWVNPVMYYVASPAVKDIVIDDIGAVSGNPNPNNNDYTGQGGGHYAVGAGYDMGTGLGSPIGGILAKDLCKFSGEPAGYWMVTADGHVYAFNVPFRGSVRNPGSRVVGIAGTRAKGYWVVTAKGKVFAFGAPNRGSVKNPSSPVVGIAGNKAGNGYWVVTASGHVYAFNAPNRGSVRNPGSKVVGIALDPQTGGYWVVTARGKVFAFNAGRYAGKNLSNVTGITADIQHQGYWLVTASGGVVAFHAPNQGGMPFGKVGTTVGIAGDPAFEGYWLATANGHVAALGSVWHGDKPGTTSAITGIASTP